MQKTYLVKILFLAMASINFCWGNELYELSNTAKIEIKKISEFNFYPLPATKAVMFYNKAENITLYISREKPEHMANRFFVTREWNSYVKNKNSSDKIPKECQQESPIKFHCSRELKIEDKEYIFESFHWNSINDTIFVQVKSSSELKTKKWAKDLKVIFKNGANP